MIDSLFKPEGGEDNGLIRELLLDFYSSTNRQKPEQIIIFRDGVGEGQFNEVRSIELAQIVEACKFLDDNWFPKVTVIIAQKNHHTRFFEPKGPRDDNVTNVPAGTVVDTGVCHPRNYDFYMCAHAGMIGTTRPTHYHVLHDDIGFSPDDLQELVHSLSYLPRCTTRTWRRRRSGSSSGSRTCWRPRRRPVAPLRPCRSCLGCIRMSGLPCSSAEFELRIGWCGEWDGYSLAFPFHV
ncbi:hypothetical protein GQ55_5G415900 [Panicum hallii var. hallii]|uniref:Piwi domain-containing protein n=1 Tax=Panicum hallii var. hallii TaxID=1504633 RepID=A0A2T7DNW3_9POAL|nr:hypothetical protein GQ55_5G415900 [Panicum hallii var. hallii]